ncbi:MAG: class I SAM-dependent methyltransferase [Oscillospiraceae bacterium]|nr:class I SAM-dependent methyltransferase [Oscillospiraceae bacterium]
MGVIFDRFYKDYDSWYDTPPGAFVDRVETGALISLLNPKPGMKILDAGCGTGNHSLKLAQGGCLVTGIDLSRQMLDRAVEKCAKLGLSVDFRLADGQSTGLCDHCFDAAISMAAFEFIPDPAGVYAEMRRVVRPGGVIVIGTIQRGSDWANLYTSPVCKGTAYEHANFLTLDDLTALDAANFDGFQECLFLPPGLPDEHYTQEQERSRRAKGRGGFVCAKYRR